MQFLRGSYVESTGVIRPSSRTFDLLERLLLLDLESEGGEELLAAGGGVVAADDDDGLDTPSPLELLDLVPFFFKKFLMVESIADI